MTDYAKLEGELWSTRNREFIPSLRKQAADALAQAVRERDEWKAGYERMSEEFVRVCGERDKAHSIYVDSYESGTEWRKRAEKAEAELASIKYSASDHELSLGIIEELRAELASVREASDEMVERVRNALGGAGRFVRDKEIRTALEAALRTKEPT